MNLGTSLIPNAQYFDFATSTSLSTSQYKCPMPNSQYQMLP
ncbi:hypothetical protein [Nostoc sp.]